MGQAESDRIGIQICQALGLNVDNIRTMDIKFRPGKPIEIVIFREATLDEANSISNMLERHEVYQIVPAEGS